MILPKYASILLGPYIYQTESDNTVIALIKL